MSNEQRADEMISVHVASMPRPRKGIYRSTYKTVTLTAAKVGEELIAASETRVAVIVQALDDDVVISGNKSDAANGNGTVIPKANTAPYPFQDSGAVWVGAQALAGATSRVSVTDIHCTYE